MARKLLLVALMCGWVSGQEWADRAALEGFLFPAEEGAMLETMKALFPMEKAGSFVMLAGKVGPSHMEMTAGAVKDDEFRDSYRQLGQYVDRAGGCFKAMYKGQQGWWSNYPDVPGEECSELIKLVAGRMLWNQIHYCRELLTTKAPDGRLDAPPVQSPVLKAEMAYAIGDALLKFGVGDRAETRRLSRELKQDQPRREFVAIEAAKAVLEHWEAMHQQHLDTKAQKTK